MLVSAAEMLKKAKAGHYAVGQFNINNLEWTKAILTAAEETKSPVILGVSEGAGKYMAGYKTVVGMVNGMLEEMKITVPVALHLDHGTYEGCQKCIEAGFSSIMFDGSHYPIEENVAKTKELAAICKEKGMSLEAEVGSIGGEEDELTLGDTLADDAPSAESILMDKELLDALYDELNRLDPDGRRICELIMQGKTEREIAADMGKRQSTINYQKNKVFDILRKALKDFI